MPQDILKSSYLSFETLNVAVLPPPDIFLATIHGTELDSIPLLFLAFGSLLKEFDSTDADDEV